MSYLGAPLLQFDVWPVLQVRTTLNMLGPLLNPAGAVYGLIGVYSPDISMLMAQSLQQLGTRKALVVHSQVSLQLKPLHRSRQHMSHNRPELDNSWR